MIFSFLAIFSIWFYGYFNSVLPDCGEVVQARMNYDALVSPDFRMQYYTHGVSVYARDKGRIYDYFLTSSYTVYQEALNHGYEDLGKCDGKGQELYFTTKSIEAEGA